VRNIVAGGLLFAAVSSSIVFAQTSNPAPQTTQGPEQGRELTREMFLEDDIAPRVEPAAFDTTIVMYTDYQCPYCRKAHLALQQLLAEDKKVRVLYRDWPIFGPASEQAARLAIASKWQGRHAEFHDALMRTPGKLSDETIRAAAKKARVDWPRLQQDLTAHGSEIEALLERNNTQAEALGLDGTPGFIIGNTFAPGGVDLAGFREMIKEARAEKPAEAKSAAAKKSAG
jgi:protein-disulfide isomerase